MSGQQLLLRQDIAVSQILKKLGQQLQPQQLLEQQDLTIPEILREYGKQFRQIQMQYSDKRNGRCAMGVIMSYFGWDGSNNFEKVNSIIAAENMLKQAGIEEDLLTDLNDSGYTFDMIADYLDRINK
jgi:hypothetical protein